MDAVYSAQAVSELIQR